MSGLSESVCRAKAMGLSEQTSLRFPSLGCSEVLPFRKTKVSTMKVRTGGRREKIFPPQLIPAYRPFSTKDSSACMVKGILFLGGCVDGWMVNEWMQNRMKTK